MYLKTTLPVKALNIACLSRKLQPWISRASMEYGRADLVYESTFSSLETISLYQGEIIRKLLINMV